MTPAPSRLSPQSTDFTPSRPAPLRTQLLPSPSAIQIPRETGTHALPWHTPAPATHPCPAALSALNKHYSDKSFPESDLAHMVERYQTDLGLIDIVLALRDGSRAPSAEAGFYPAPRMDDSEPDNSTVFVGGLSGGIGVEILRVFFLPFGVIDYVKTPEGKGCGFVRFKYRQDAENAIAKMQGFEVESCRFRLSWGRNPNNDREAPCRTINPGLIRRLTGYVDPVHAKDLLTCIDSVFDGNTRLFREALEYLNSTVVPSREARGSTEYEGGGSTARGGGGRGSWNAPVSRVSAYDRPPARGDWEAREEPPHYRLDSGVPTPRTSLSAGAQSFDYDHSHNRRPVLNHLAGTSEYPEAPRPLQRHDSISAASSDAMYHLELEYNQPELPGSDPVRANTRPSDETWSDDIDPSFYSPRPTVTPAPGSGSECTWSCWASPPGYAHANGHVRPGTVEPPVQRQTYRLDHGYGDPAGGYGQAYTAAPRQDISVTIAGSTGPAVSNDMNVPRKSSDPVKAVGQVENVEAVILASQGHYGSVGQGQRKDLKSDIGAFPMFSSWTSTTTPTLSKSKNDRKLGSGSFTPFEPIEKNAHTAGKSAQIAGRGEEARLGNAPTMGTVGKSARSATPVWRSAGVVQMPGQGDGRVPVGPRGVVRA